MPDPITDHRMNWLGGRIAAKWLFAVVRRECLSRRCPDVDRPAFEAMCRQHQIPFEAIDDLVTVIDGDGAYLFLRPADGGRADVWTLVGDWFDPPVTSTARVQRLRRERSEVEQEALPNVEAVIDLNSKIGTVTKSFDVAGESLPTSRVASNSRGRARRVVTQDELAQVYDAWRTAQDDEFGAGTGARRKASPNRNNAIKAALQRGESLEKCCAAVRGWRWDDWPRRLVDRHDITDCLRPANIDRFSEWELGSRPRLRQSDGTVTLDLRSPAQHLGRIAHNAAVADDLLAEAARLRAARGGG